MSQFLLGRLALIERELSVLYTKKMGAAVADAANRPALTPQLFAGKQGRQPASGAMDQEPPHSADDPDPMLGF